MPLQRELVLSRVRIAQLRAKWDHALKGIKTATDIAEKLERLPPSGEVPSSIMPDRVSLNRDFGVVSGEPNQLKSPLRVLAEATVSGPPTWRYWATNLMLGLVVGLLLPTALSLAYFVVRGDN